MEPFSSHDEFYCLNFKKWIKKLSWLILKLQLKEYLLEIQPSGFYPGHRWQIKPLKRCVEDIIVPGLKPEVLLGTSSPGKTPPL